MAKAATKKTVQTKTATRAKVLKPSDRAKKRSVTRETDEERKRRLKREASARYYAKKKAESSSVAKPSAKKAKSAAAAKSSEPTFASVAVPAEIGAIVDTLRRALVKRAKEDILRQLSLTFGDDE